MQARPFGAWELSLQRHWQVVDREKQRGPIRWTSIESLRSQDMDGHRNKIIRVARTRSDAWLDEYTKARGAAGPSVS